MLTERNEFPKVKVQAFLIWPTGGAAREESSSSLTPLQGVQMGPQLREKVLSIPWKLGKAEQHECLGDWRIKKKRVC